MALLARIDEYFDKDLRSRAESRLAGMRTDRYSWWVYWQELATFILPRRYRWLVSPNNYNRGSPINTAILDSTGTVAARTLAAGMMSGITSPTRPWFRLRIEGYGGDDTHPVNLWLSECEKRMMRVFSESNFYNAVAVLYYDLVVFGTGTMLIYEDFTDVIRCYNPCAGEYYVANSDRLFIDTFYREFVLTTSQVVQWFGIENCSESVREAYKRGGTSLTQEIVVCHGIEPNVNPKAPGVPSHFPIREMYWEQGSTEPGKFLSLRGFHEMPGIFPRWDITGNDSYGRCPAMDALGDIKQLQQEQRRKAQAIDKMVNPPMVADVQMKNQPASTIPGGVTYVNGLGDRPGFAPAYQVQPRIAEMMQDIAQVQQRIRDVFYVDLFMMISQLQTVRTATEIDARREEKLVMLGPVLERFQNEALDPLIDRVFAVMSRAGLLPPPPKEVSNRQTPIQVEYVSMLADAQRAAATAGIERTLQVAGSIAPVNIEVLDNIDFDVTLRDYAGRMNIDPKDLRPWDQVIAIREERAKQKASEAAMQFAKPATDAAKVLSQTDLGGGKNALQAMLASGSEAA